MCVCPGQACAVFPRACVHLALEHMLILAGLTWGCIRVVCTSMMFCPRISPPLLPILPLSPRRPQGGPAGPRLCTDGQHRAPGGVVLFCTLCSGICLVPTADLGRWCHSLSFTAGMEASEERLS